jgi:hypothetical protein
MTKATDRRLPDVIRRYLDAHDARNTDAALTTFTSDATVIDEDHAHHGSDQIRTWLTTAATEFTYTRSLINADPSDSGTWVVTNRLEGNFPGGVVDLRYRFTLRHGLIAELLIAP